MLAEVLTLFRDLKFVIMFHSLLKVTTPSSFREGTSRIFPPPRAERDFSPQHSRLVFVFNKPFMRQSWLFPVCIWVMIKLNPTTSELKYHYALLGKNILNSNFNKPKNNL